MKNILLVSTFIIAILNNCLSDPLPSPKEYFGFSIGDDYHLVNYRQTQSYFKKLSEVSDRVRYVNIGKTEEGRDQVMMVISDSANLNKLAEYKAISQKLAKAEGLTELDAQQMALLGKAVVWIDGGLHADETAGAHQLIETVWRLVSSNSEETKRILHDVIILCVHANPDGQELVSNWYMREKIPAKRILDRTPKLWEKYAGHDNNRDFFMSALKETANMNRQMYLEWFPQIVYNHHQYGPPGTIIFIPPYRNPFNYVCDPLVITGIDALGTAIEQRYLLENKFGATSRSGALYSTWWNGGLRTMPYFHNMVGILTESVGSPTPTRIPLVLNRQLPNGDLLAPVVPQMWHFKQTIEYEVSANYAILDYASRNRQSLLYSIYRMGLNSIQRGSADNWTIHPSRISEVANYLDKNSHKSEDAQETETVDILNRRLASSSYELLHKNEWRDPRGFIIPSNQVDFPTAVKFINTLIQAGIRVEKATDTFVVNGVSYPKNSYIVKTNQAFRPHILDMFEPQDYPNDFKYPGGPPIKPYDSTGWTLAFEMGVHFVRVLDDFNGPFKTLTYGVLEEPISFKVVNEQQTVGYLISHKINDSFIIINRLLKRNQKVYWLEHGKLGDGTIYVPRTKESEFIVQDSAQTLGVEVENTSQVPHARALLIKPNRIALWDKFGGSIPSGWMRYILEKYEFPFDLVFSKEIDLGNLNKKFDLIIFPTAAIPSIKADVNHSTVDAVNYAIKEPADSKIPDEYRSWLGSITVNKSIPKINEFIMKGGSVVAIGTSTNLAYDLNIPLENALLVKTAKGSELLSSEKFYVPGSILTATVNNNDPMAWGLDRSVDFYYDNNPIFKKSVSIIPVVTFETDKPLKSGWGWGQLYLKDSVLVGRTNIGLGKLYLIGSDITFRAQTHGTFKLLFNALYLNSNYVDL